MFITGGGASTRLNMRVCQVVYDDEYYNFLVGVDDLDNLDTIIQNWAIDNIGHYLTLPADLVYSKNITEVITTLDIDNYVYIPPDS